MSEYARDPSAGLNGGFEVSVKGLPANWLIYSPRTVPEAEFEIHLDTTDVKEGKQALQFSVSSCSAAGGWHSPGFTNEFFEVGKFKGPNRYKLSFWVKNKGSRFEVSAGGVSAKGGDMNVLIDSRETIAEWKRLTFEIDVASGNWLRMQLNILQPGIFWIDGVQIEEL